VVVHSILEQQIDLHHQQEADLFQPYLEFSLAMLVDLAVDLRLHLLRHLQHRLRSSIS
jgi:hypothetical protein